MADINPLEMSDEDFAKLNGPPVVEDQTTTTTTATTTDTTTDGAVTEQTSEVVEENTTTTEDTTTATTTDTEVVDDKTDDKTGEKEAGAEGGADAGAEGTKGAGSEQQTGKTEGDGKVETENKEKKPEETQTAPPNYKELYEKMMQPIKANGKQIELRNPEELIQLAQQGADYTRKLQALAPYRKIGMMLENNGLLDEGKLSFLIDLERGDPEALKKFIKDKNINVLDIDTESDHAYTPGNHEVSDPEVAFKTTMKELGSTVEGQATINEIHNAWDDTSKEALWNSPELMTVIHQQREAGLYAKISTEIDRRKTLGSIPANTPFLQAYKLVGDEWAQKAIETQRAEEEKARVLATRAATPKTTVENDDKASAASATKTTAKTAKTVVNPLSMSDEEFMKQANLLEGRI
jgi:hypothetical protein